MAKYQYSDDELGGIIENEISQAAGAESDELRSHQKEALGYYFNKPRGDEKDGESAAQSSDLADMVNAVLAQLTPMVSSDALATFEAVGEQDEDAARAESHAINDLVMDKNQGYVELQQALKDASLCRNAFAKIWVEDRERAEVRTFANVRRGDVARVVQTLDRVPGQEAMEQSHDKESGETKIKVIKKQRVFRWRSVDPINFLYQAGWESLDLQDIRFCAERDTPTRSDLLAEGYDRAAVEEIPTINTETRSEAHARHRRHEMVNYTPQTTDQERVERHECFLKIDMDGDGISEQWRIVVGNKKQVLEKEMVDWVPFASGSLFLASHRLEGEDLFDRLKQTQDVKTAGLRRWLDNLYAATWGRLAAQLNVVDEDIDDARAGATIWTKRNPNEALMAVPYTDVGQSCQALLDYQDKVRTERGGAALDMQGPAAQLAGETYRGIERQYSVKEQLTQMMAKNIAETLIRGLYLLMHRTVRTFATEPMAVKLRGEWQQVDPRSWPARSSMNVVPGLTPAARMGVEQAMQQLLQLSIMAVEKGLGGQIASLDGMYRQAVDMARAKGVDNPGQYLVDPSSTQAQQAAQQQQQQAQQAAQQQQAMMQAQIQLAQTQLRIEQEKNRSQRYVDIYKADLDAELKEAELIVEGRQNELDAQQRARESAAETAAAVSGNSSGANGSGAG